jgi:flagellar biosynthetic protein FliP
MHKARCFERYQFALASVAVVLGVLVVCHPAFAEPAAFQQFGIPALTITSSSEGEQQYSLSLQIIAIMTMFSFLPAMVLMMTCFTRIVIVFSILRQAMGLQQTPSSQVIVGLSIFLSFFIMSPILERAYEGAVVPYINKEISEQDALDRLQKPFRQFMLSQTREPDLALFLKIRSKHAFAKGHEADGTMQKKTERDVLGVVTNDPNASDLDFDPETVPLSTLIPAFVISELKTALQIGFMLFIPFLIIDIVVASILMAMGMMMLSPLIVSLPFKIMLFVFVDGWAMIVSTLTASFGL